MNYSVKSGLGAAGLVTTLIVAVGFLFAAPSQSSAAVAAAAAFASCEAEVGGDHCCACGDSGSGPFCTEIAQNAYAECNTAGLCNGTCSGSVE